MLEIKEITLTDYYFMMFGMRTCFTDLCARSADSSGGRIIMALYEQKPVGFVCFERGRNETRLLCCFTREDCRRQGVFTELLKYAKNTLPRPIKMSIAEEHRSFAAVDAALRKAGFVSDGRCVVFRGERNDYPEWERFMERSGSGMCAYLGRRGFSAVPFSQLSEAALERIKNSTSNDYEGDISALGFFENPAKNMDMDASFAAVKDGVPEAFVLVSRPDEGSFVFEIISASKKYMTTGVVLLPFAHSMCAFKDSGSGKIRYAMYESNVHANAFRKKLLDKVTSARKYSDNYILKG